MTPERWSRIKTLFHAAVALAPAERAAFLEASCAEEPEPVELRAELDRLLTAHEELAATAKERAPDTAAPGGGGGTALSGRDTGRYAIGRLIGSGGMGQVYLAID